MKIGFRSVFKIQLKEFIELKRKMGRKYETAEAILLQFDRLAYYENVRRINISKSLSNKWCAKRKWETSKYHQTRVSLLNAFSKYLNDNGYKSFIPRIPHVKNTKFVPYIFTKQEISHLIDTIDSFKITRINSRSTAFIYPCLFRVLYSTGIRIKEALNLKRIDIDFQNQFVRVKDFKNSKERIIPLSKSLSISLKKYIDYQDRLGLIEKPEYLFTNLRGQKITRHSVYRHFDDFLKNSGIPRTNCGPRIHDLRHTFAVHSLAKMFESGINTDVSLPYLSTYLGHQSIAATEDYLRLTFEVYPDLVRRSKRLYEGLYPEIKE